MLLAQAQATPDAVEVRLVDEGKAGWEKFVVPAVTLVAALVGGIGGVVIGGRMNRTTMNKLESDRAKREKKLEDERADRETRLEEAKANRELASERRMALGSSRLLVRQCKWLRAELRYELATIGLSEATSTSSFGRSRMEIDLRLEDKHAIAMWVSDDAWNSIAMALEGVEEINRTRASVREALDSGQEIDLSNHRDAVSSTSDRIDRMLEALDSELPRSATH